MCKHMQPILKIIIFHLIYFFKIKHLFFQNIPIKCEEFTKKYCFDFFFV